MPAVTFAEMLHWLDPQADGMRTVHLGSPALSAAALKAVLVFMYTERLDVGIEEVEPVLRLMRKCRLKHMVPCIQKERRTLRYHSKSLRKDEAGPRRSAAAAVSAHAVMQCCACKICIDAKQVCIVHTVYIDMDLRKSGSLCRCPLQQWWCSPSQGTSGSRPWMLTHCSMAQQKCTNLCLCHHMIGMSVCVCWSTLCKLMSSCLSARDTSSCCKLLNGSCICRFVLQPGMLPEEARLAYDLRCLRQRAAALEAAGATVSAADFADIILLIDSVSFR